MRQGRRVGAQRRRDAGARAASSRSRYRTLGVFVDMGRRQAVAETLRHPLARLLAWFLARTYHLPLMPGFGRRIRLLVEWNVGLVFGRDTVRARAAGAPRVARGHGRGGGAGGEGLMQHDAHGWWIAEAGAPAAAPALTGDVDADVVVIGGGFTGHVDGVALAGGRAGRARRRCSRPTAAGIGPSGRNGGFVRPCG